MSKLERVDYGKPETGSDASAWGMIGLFSLIVAIGLIFAAVIFSQQPTQEPTSPSGTAVRQALTVSPEKGEITAHDHFYPKETAETITYSDGKKQEVRAWWSIEHKVALAAHTNKAGQLLVAIMDDKKRLHNGWQEASGEISQVEVYAVPHDGQVDGTAGFELDGKPWVLQSSKDASILMADALLQVPHKEDLQDMKFDESHRIGVNPK